MINFLHRKDIFEPPCSVQGGSNVPIFIDFFFVLYVEELKYKQDLWAVFT